MDYSSEVRRRFFETPGAGAVAACVSGEGEDRSLNVWVRFELEIAGERVAAARFQAFGCPHTIAAASWAAEWIEGRGVEALAGFDAAAVAEHLEIPTEKLGKVLRVEDALLECRGALDNLEASAPGAPAADNMKGS